MAVSSGPRSALIHWVTNLGLRPEPLGPDELIEANFRETALSGLGEISRSSYQAKPLPHILYEVSVIRWFVGRGPQRLTLHQATDYDAKPAAPGLFIVFSTCKLRSGVAHEPDVGYFFPHDRECLAEAERRGAAAAQAARLDPNDKASSVCRD